MSVLLAASRSFPFMFSRLYVCFKSFLVSLNNVRVLKRAAETILDAKTSPGLRDGNGGVLFHILYYMSRAREPFWSK